MTTIETSTRAEQTMLRNDCLRRDGYRCVFSGMWDIGATAKGIAHPLPTDLECYVECAHILPFALGVFDESDAVQTRNKAIIWFCIHRYFPQIQHKIDARSINQRSNAMSLERSLHKSFGEYRVAFSPQDDQHPNDVELVKIFDRRLFLPASKSGSSKVQFIRADSNVPMPDPDYLKVHQSIGQILQVSGFGRVISIALEDSWLALDCRGLHPDGTTDVGALLSNLLLTNVRAGPTEDQDPSPRKSCD
ncbi:hypothetical protein SPBR_00979 [Sporothrix brasiliensis 5110]|uniref:HNH nuclease domain-containing protein n=1 Tax=Sporothrix brasiliensis 5110 TaxID=1398154 RepID=A0A0C2EWH0_9PEZI|nr:uncharacterized protein SPBR_00979 [Sporothrix brasiliensis 5110]KIH90929.1 hypothetical protein SPBR_00979 [Sporothrix brasiliensis 5110]